MEYVDGGAGVRGDEGLSPLKLDYRCGRHLAIQIPPLVVERRLASRGERRKYVQVTWSRHVTRAYVAPPILRCVDAPLGRAAARCTASPLRCSNARSDALWEGTFIHVH